MLDGDLKDGIDLVAFRDKDSSGHCIGVERDAAIDDPGTALEDGGAAGAMAKRRVCEAFEDLETVDPFDEMTTFTVSGGLETLADL